MKTGGAIFTGEMEEIPKVVTFKSRTRKKWEKGPCKDLKKSFHVARKAMQMS